MPQDTIDPKVKKLVSAIAQTETGQANPNAYTKRGASGEYGRYQYTKDTWDRYAREAGVNEPHEGASMEAQNKVTYYKIKQFKDKGYTPAQIASMWNAGEDDPDAYKGTFSNGKPSVGVNSFGVRYDVPDYARKVSAAYMGGGGNYNAPPAPQPFQAPANTGLENLQGNLGMEKQGLVGQLGQDMSNVGTGITKAVQDTSTGAINPASGVLQGAGAIAGGVGQVVDTSLKNLPFGIGKAYEFGSEKVGQAVAGAAEATGATAVFNKLSPEIQGNIGAAGNIASLVPFFKAFATGKRGLSDSLTKLREPSVKKQATSELDEALGSSARADNLRKTGAVQELVDKDLVPDVVETAPGVYRFDVKDAQDKIQKEMKDVIAKQDEFAKTQTATYKQSELGGYAKRGDKTQTLSPLHDSLDELKKHYSTLRDPNGQLWVDEISAKLKSDSITVEDINNVARKLGAESPAYLKSLDLTSQTKGRAMENLRRQLKDMVGDRDASGQMRKLDKDYSKLESQKKALIQIKKGRVRPKKAGLVRGLLKEIPGSGLVMKDSPSTATMRLARRRPLRSTAQKGLKQLAVGQALSNQQGQEKR